MFDWPKAPSEKGAHVIQKKQATAAIKLVTLGCAQRAANQVVSFLRRFSVSHPF
jgi:hypothetical protein